ncbi:MAG: hypothetical protein IJB73_07790 [Firmicutes bacterium]|nr:hypothetical protein [Bacillota bacterium]
MKIIEATFIMPVTCLITVSLIALMIWMYNQFLIQTETHDVQREELYKTAETASIRIYDKIYEEFAE